MRTPGAIAILLALASVVPGCGGGQKPAEIARRLDAHVEKVFAGVVADDAARLEADKQRVRDVHAIATLVEDYKKRGVGRESDAAHPPLHEADRRDVGRPRQTVHARTAVD
jgi:hypothetical protein